MLLTNSRFYNVAEQREKKHKKYILPDLVQINVINYIRSVVWGMTLVARQYTARNLQTRQFMHTASNSEKRTL